ncbi:MAG TPA: maleylpyruvate isomerase family mycothiol-dependent enzyme [Streptosporangiaceae bacterium]
MSLSTADCLSAITSHSAGLAAAAEGDLDAAVRHCPGWSVADLVAHVSDVHWFWATIAAGRLAAPPDESSRPARAPRKLLIATLRDGADHLASVLRAADQRDRVWTWAPAQQDVAFITRHQVQEAAVHHWDAVDAAGGALAIEAPVAADSVEEFLTFSVSSDADPAEPARPALAGSFALRCTDADAAWTVRDGGQAGTIRLERGAGDSLLAVTGTASDLLLWLYGRVSLDSAVPPALLQRFRALTISD